MLRPQHRNSNVPKINRYLECGGPATTLSATFQRKRQRLKKPHLLFDNNLLKLEMSRYVVWLNLTGPHPFKYPLYMSLIVNQPKIPDFV